MATPWIPISGIVPQATTNGNQANGMVLKFYETGTLTPLAVSTNSTGSPTTTEFVLNTQGYTTLSTVIEIPHVNSEYKIVLYLDQTDADANDTGSAVYVKDAISLGNIFKDVQSDYDNLAAALAGPDLANTFVTVSERVDGSGVGGGVYEVVSVNPLFNLINPAKTDGSGNYLKLLFNASVNPYQAGAVGNGVAVDTLSLQEAIDASPVDSVISGGGKMLIDARIDLINKTLRNVVLKYSESTTSSTVVVTGTAKMEHCTIEASSNRPSFSAALSGMVTLHLSTGSVIDDLTILNGDSNDTGILCTTKASDVTIKNCTMDYIGWPILFNDTNGNRTIDSINYDGTSIGDNLYIRNNSVGADDKTSVGDAIEINCPVSRMSNINIIDNTALKTVSSGAANGLGMAVANCDGVNIRGNTVENCPSAAGSLHVEHCISVIISNNTVLDGAQAIGVGVEGEDHIINGNFIARCTLGIQCIATANELENISITNNQILNIDNFCIVVVNALNTTITGNTISGLTSASGTWLSLQQTGSLTMVGVLVSGNQFIDNAAGGGTSILGKVGTITDIISADNLFIGFTSTERATYASDIATRGLCKDLIVLGTDASDGMDIRTTRDPNGFITGALGYTALDLSTGKKWIHDGANWV